MKVWAFEFRISGNYDERQVEELLELLEMRGAYYKHQGGPTYKLHVPEPLDYKPFYQTVLDCESVSWVDNTIYPLNYIPITAGD